MNTTTDNPFRSWLVDALERAFASLVQALLVFVPLLFGVWDEALGRTMLAAGFAAVGAVLLAVLLAPVPKPRSWLGDAVFRVVRTFLVTVLSLALASGFDLFSVSGWRSVLLAGLVSALAVVKAFLAKLIPGTITPASFAHPPAPS